MKHSYKLAIVALTVGILLSANLSASITRADAPGLSMYEGTLT